MERTVTLDPQVAMDLAQFIEDHFSQVEDSILESADGRPVEDHLTELIDNLRGC